MNIFQFPAITIHIQQKKTTIFYIVNILQMQASNISCGFFFFKDKASLQNIYIIKPKAHNTFTWSSIKTRHQVYAKTHKALPPEGSLSTPRHNRTDSPRLAQQLRHLHLCGGSEDTCINI